jgi:hypothetical protein
MKIECITICVGYCDFLREVLPHNLAHFDDYLVVTRFDDEPTRSLCRELGVECRPTDLFDKGGDRFAKGRAIDWGLGFLRRDGWVCHLDADIYLPPMTRHLIEASEPDEQCIYGCDRVNCVGFDAWRKYLSGGATDSQAARSHVAEGRGRVAPGVGCAAPLPLDPTTSPRAAPAPSPRPGHLFQHRNHCLLSPPPFPLGSRLVLREQGGYVPIGFFQLWHGRHGRRYPLRQGNAEHTDVLHALQWPRDKRRLLEEVFAVHLESEPSRMGANWSGRKTAPFGPVAVPPPPDRSYMGSK